MGSSLSCCTYDLKDKRLSLEELYLEDTNKDFYSNKRNFTLDTQNNITEIQISPKNERENEDERQTNVSNPILKVIITNITDKELNQTCLLIDKKGLVNSKKNQENQVFFGCVDDENERLDVVLPNSQIKDGRQYGRHFCIYYDESNEYFTIKDLGKGLGLFFRINTEYILRNNSVIGLDDAYIFVSISEEDESIKMNIFLENGNINLENL